MADKASSPEAGLSRLPPLPRARVEAAVQAALAEDLGDAGDITSDAVIPASKHATARLMARTPGRLAGLALAEAAFRLMDPSLRFTPHAHDGAVLAAGECVAEVAGAARAILAAERVALNFLGHLSGIATTTAAIAEAVAAYKARVCCTRKTTPGLRLFEKYAVRAGGGVNHRFGLYDAILIKDNHIAAAGGIGPAIEAAREAGGHMVKIEVEVDTLGQLGEALTHPIDAVLLDNMTPAQLTEAVKMINGRAISEASGGITVETAPDIAATGVDLLSVGWITHSAPCLDLGLDFDTDA